MAGYFKKRKGPQGPNKNEQKVLRGRDAEIQASRGMLGALFPDVKKIRIKSTFLDIRQNVLDESASEMSPTDVLSLTRSCPGRCGGGSFDFSTILSGAITARLPMVEGNATCKEPLFAGASETCGCQAKVRMEIDYFPAPESVANG